MKDKVYNVTVAATEDEIVSCKCDCQAGSQGSNRGLCVHILPVLLLFSVMLVNDLAQNILVELCHRWDEHLERKFEKNCNNKMQQLKISIISLLNASGEDDISINRAKANVKVSEMLENFSVGTEKSKVFFSRPKKDELIPISEMKFQSNSAEVKRLLNPVDSNDDHDLESSFLNSNHKVFIPEYTKIADSVTALCKVLDDNIDDVEDNIGWKLVQLRKLKEVVRVPVSAADKRAKKNIEMN